MILSINQDGLVSVQLESTTTSSGRATDTRTEVVVKQAAGETQAVAVEEVESVAVEVPQEAVIIGNGDAVAVGTEGATAEGTEGTVVEGTEGEIVDDTEGEIVDDTAVEGEVVEGEVVEGEVVEGEAMDGAVMEESAGEVVIGKEGEIIGGDYTGDMGGGMYPEVGVEAGAAKGSVMTSWVFVIGISTVTLAVSIVLGILLAKKRIKKGFDLYED